MMLQVIRGTSHYPATVFEMFQMPLDQCGLLTRALDLLLRLMRGLV